MRSPLSDCSNRKQNRLALSFELVDDPSGLVLVYEVACWDQLAGKTRSGACRLMTASATTPLRSGSERSIHTPGEVGSFFSSHYAQAQHESVGRRPWVPAQTPVS